MFPQKLEKRSQLKDNANKNMSIKKIFKGNTPTYQAFTNFGLLLYKHLCTTGGWFGPDAVLAIVLEIVHTNSWELLPNQGQTEEKLSTTLKKAANPSDEPACLLPNGLLPCWPVLDARLYKVWSWKYWKYGFGKTKYWRRSCQQCNIMSQQRPWWTRRQNQSTPFRTSNQQGCCPLTMAPQ